MGKGNRPPGSNPPNIEGFKQQRENLINECCKDKVTTPSVGPGATYIRRFDRYHSHMRGDPDEIESVGRPEQQRLRRDREYNELTRAEEMRERI